jgi:hypothetical protein
MPLLPLLHAVPCDTTVLAVEAAELQQLVVCQLRMLPWLQRGLGLRQGCAGCASCGSRQVPNKGQQVTDAEEAAGVEVDTQWLAGQQLTIPAEASSSSSKRKTHVT